MSEACSLPVNHPGYFSLTDRSRDIVRLDDLGIVRVSGKDAVTFLHGQFTNVVKGLGLRTIAAGYCSPKGRLLATFRLWMEGDDVMMMLPRAVAPAFVKRLKMFVLRADVTFTCACHDRTIYGLLNKTKDNLTAAGLTLPPEGDTARKDDTIVLGLSASSAIDGLIDAAPRAIVIAPKTLDLFPADKVADNSALWWVGNIAAGVATVWPETREVFVPQAVNYELTGGVVFNKGCYPGQEVVSRVQHIGESPRRAFIGWADTAEDVLPGATVWSDGKESGFVIESVRVEEKTLVIFSAALAAKEKGFSLSEAGAAVTVLPLPYEIRNVLNR